MSESTTFISTIDSSLRERLEAMDNLPVLPEIYNELSSELSSNDVSMQRIASIVSRDMGITAKLLKVLNSAYFGLKREIRDVLEAVNYLGIETVKGVVLSAGVFSNSTCAAVSGFSPTRLYESGVAVGPKARFIAHAFGMKSNVVDESLTAGLLHDIGKLVLISGFADEFAEAYTMSKNENVRLHTAIERVLGANDATIGGYLLSSWGFPPSLVEAVSFHFEPSRQPSTLPNATTAVHLAYASEHDQKFRQAESAVSAFDLEYTDSLGITNQLAQFKGLSAEAVK